MPRNELEALLSTKNEPEERITWVNPDTECKPNVYNLRNAVENTILSQLTKVDNVNHPSHYCDGNIETIDYIEDKHLNFHLGNVVKYVSRAGKKYPDRELEDLMKARWYLNRYIGYLEDLNEENEEKI